MNIEQEDPLSGYGIWDGASPSESRPRKSLYADYDPDDPFGSYDPDHPYELMHLLRDIGPGDQYRRVSRFSTASFAVAVGQILSVAMPYEYSEERPEGQQPILIVWYRTGDSGWGETYSCGDSEMSTSIWKTLILANRQHQTLEDELK